MKRPVGAIRAVIALLLMPVGLALLLVSALSPFMFAEDAAENRQLLSVFQRTEGFVATFRTRHGRLPDTDEIRAWANRQNLGWASSSIDMDHVSCEGGFTKRAEDQYLLGVWRGEWEDCYASPSGRHTLTTSVGDFLTSWEIVALATLFLSGLSICWLAYRIWPGRSDWQAWKDRTSSVGPQA